MYAIEVLEVGDSLGFILPEEMLKRLQVGVGDTLFLTQTTQGFNLTTVDTQPVQDSFAELPPIQTPVQATNQNKK